MKTRGFMLLSAVSLMCPSATSSVRIRPSASGAFLSRPLRGGSDSDVPLYPPDQETFQNRIDAWKRQQESTYAQQTEEQQASPVDIDGRMKLLGSCSKGARALIFFLLMWRSVHLYEVADQSLKGTLRLIIVIPLMLLFVANLAGTIASLTSPGHSSKKRLKAILNLDKLVEGLLIIFCFLRLTVIPSKVTAREVFIANTIHSIFFILQAQTFTRVKWDEVAQAQTHPFDTTQPPPEDDFPMYDQTPQDYYEGSYDTGNYDYSNDGQQQDQDQNQNYY